MLIKYLGGRVGSSYLDDILEFDPLTGQWKLVDRMTKTRGFQAMSVLNYSEVAQFCN